jgi:hypothetical protein
MSPSRAVTEPLRIPIRDARRLAIRAQRLAGPRPKPTRAGVMEIVRDIGYLQLDPTNVVARNPQQILQSRLGRYDTAVLEDLLSKRRELFETPSLILPVTDLPIHAATMRAYRRATDPRGEDKPYGPGDNAGGGTWARRVRAWLKKNPHMRRRVLARLRREGPLPLSAFEDRTVVSWTSGGWNDERNVTMLLAILQRRGEVVVAGRRRGQKLWAIADGWLDPAERIGDLEVEKRATERAIRALGVATVKQLKWHYAFSRHVTARALAALEREGRIVRVHVDPDGDGPAKRKRIAPMRKAPVAKHRPRDLAAAVFYAPADVERRLRDVRGDWEGRTTLLSPFDNLVIDRDRADLLFDFFYRMEIYVPPKLRRRGYWAMPVVHDDAIVGTIDPRFEREAGRLVVRLRPPRRPARARPRLLARAPRGRVAGRRRHHLRRRA